MHLHDNWEFKTTTDAVIFLNEFKKYYMNISAEPGNYNHFFAIIFLQIYVEYFLHQYMRLVSNMTPLNKNFAQFEHLHLRDKKDEPWTGKISKFIQCFALIDDSIAIKAKTDMDSALKKLNRVRNSIVHGHDFSKTFATNRDHAELSIALKRLNNTSIEILIGETNKIGIGWNTILERLFLKSQEPGNTWRFNEVKSFMWNKLIV